MYTNAVLSAIGALALSSSVGAISLQSSKYDCQEFTVSSQDKAEIQTVIDSYLKAIGGDNNGSEIGDQGSGFRSINWDGAGLPFVAPPNFFNFDVPRGLQYDSEKDFMAASNPAPDAESFGAGDNLLDTFNKGNVEEFAAFSEPRIFCPFDSPFFETKFFEAGTTTDANTQAFGAVALDVTGRDRAFMEYFDEDGNLVYKLDFLRQPGLDKGFSFSGLVCSEPVIHKVEVTLGKELFQVCIDDVFFGEPTGKYLDK